MNCSNHKESGWFGKSKALSILCMSALALLSCFPVFAQLNLGHILGAISDQSGGLVPGATLTVTDVARGVSRTLTTDSAGEYSAPSLVPSTYTIRAEAKGFRTIERQNVVVGVGQDVRVDLTLQPGEQTQTVTVTEAIPVMQTTNAQISETLENQAINDLPLNGREYEKLISYRPGVKSNGLDLYVNGNRSDNNSWMFDGLEDFNEWSASGPIVGGQNMFDEATILPIDAIQEVNIIESPKAEYGWKPGAEVNVGLKSGTNSIHGTAFAFGRDTAMDARNPFLPPTFSKAVDNLEQFGGSIGGPIKKDKLFFFGTYEGQRTLVGSPNFVQIPTAVPGAGPGSSFPDAIADLQAHGVPLSQLSLNMAGCTAAGVCNPASGLFFNSTNSTTVPLALNDETGSDNGLSKIDYHLKEHNALNGEYFFGRGHIINASAPALAPYWRTYSKTRAQVARAVWVWTPNSNIVNEARFGYDRMDNPQFVAECVQTRGVPNYGSQFGFVSGATPPSPWCGFPRLKINGFDEMGSNTGQGVLFGVFHGADAVSLTHGKHLFKFGGEIHRVNFTGGDNGNTGGRLRFGDVTPASYPGATALDTFLAGIPAQGIIQIGNGQRNLVQHRYALFAQDDWRVTPRLTANLGVRWEYAAPYSERNNLLGNFDPTSTTGLVQLGGKVSHLYQGDHDAFGPRLGLAWDVTGKGTTVVRAGASIVYNTAVSISAFLSDNAALNLIPTGWTLVSPNGSPLASPGNITVGTASLTGSQLNWATNTPVFNTVGASAPQCGNGLGSVDPASPPDPATNPANPPPCSIQGVDPNLQMAYVTTWNLAIQHAFGKDLSATLAYIGSHGTHLGAPIDINQPALGATNTGSAPGSANELSRRPYYSKFPYLGQILYYTGGLISNYNALQATLDKRLSRGFSVQAGFSWSHSLTETDSERGFNLMDGANPALDYGSSIQDPFTHFTLSVTYNIPGIKSPGEMLEGWQINSIVDLTGGVPFSATDASTDISGTGELTDRWTLVGNPKNFKVGGVSTVPCFGVAGSSFDIPNCTTVPSLAAMPAACLTAAGAEQTGPGATTGTQSLANFGCYLQGGSVIVPPAQGTFGTMGRGVLRGAAFNQWDMSVTKGWKFKERLTAQFRAEFFNILNHTYFSQPASDPSSPSSFGQSQSEPIQGNPIVGNGGPRQVQLGLKLIF